jgi:hypothetical protein
MRESVGTGTEEDESSTGRVRAAATLRPVLAWHGTTTLQHTGHLTTLYDKPPYRSVFSRNSDGSRSSLKMADYCRNM